MITLPPREPLIHLRKVFRLRLQVKVFVLTVSAQDLFIRICTLMVESQIALRDWKLLFLCGEEGQLMKWLTRSLGCYLTKPLT